MSSSYNIMSRHVELDPGWYRSAIGPMIGIRKDDQSHVALIPGKTHGYSFYDYETGKKRHLNASTEKLFENTAIMFYQPFPSGKKGSIALLEFMRNNLNGADLTGIILVTVLITVLGLVLPWLNNMLIGSVIVTGRIQFLLALGVFFAGTIISLCIFEATKTILADRISLRLGIGAEAAIMMKILVLPADFFRKYSSGDLARRAVSREPSLVSRLSPTVPFYYKPRIILL